MAASGIAETISGDVADFRILIEIEMGHYCEAIDLFIDELKKTVSDYDQNVANHHYLFAAAEIIDSIAEILGYQDISSKAVFIRDAARSYQDYIDIEANQQELDGTGARRTFSSMEWKSQFLRSRLKARADRAYSTWQLQTREVETSENFNKIFLKFILNFAFDLPVKAWECTSCLRNFGECGYDDVCLSQESTRNGLAKSNHGVLKYIRWTIWEMKRAGGFQERSESSTGSEDMTSELLEEEIFGDFEVVKGEYD